MKKDLVLTTCHCEKHPDDVVITKTFLKEMTAYNQVATRTKVFDEIIQHLEVKRDVYFSQSLINGATYFTHKSRTIEDLIKELEDMKCR